MRCGFGYFKSKLSGTRRSHAHGAGVLPYIDLVKQTVDATILLVDANGERYSMTGIVGNFLEFVAQLGRVLGSYRALVGCQPQLTVKPMSLTLEVLSSEQNGAQMVLFDKRLDLRRDSSAIKAHHEQLALDSRSISSTH